MRRTLLHEWRLLRGDRGVAVLLALLCTLVAYAAWSGAQVRDAHRETARLAVEREAARRADQRAALASAEREGRPTTELPEAAAMPWGPRDVAVLPISPLATVAVGQADLAQRTAGIGLFRTASDLFPGYAVENPAVLAVGRLDLAFVLTYVLPLVLLALTFNVVSSEREQGTLSLLLTQPVPFGRVLLTRLVVRGAGVTGAFLVVSAVALVLVGGAPRHAEDTVLLAAAGAVVVVYAAFWVALAWLVNVLTRTSASNALVLGTAWLLCVIVVPAGLNLAMQVTYPLPSRGRLANEEREAQTRAQQQGQELLGTYMQQHPDLLPATAGGGEANPVSAGAREYWAVLERARQVVEPVAADFEQRLAAQRAFVERVQYLSPAVLVQQVLNDVAGTGHERLAAFRRQAVQALRDWQGTLAPRMFQGRLLRSEDYDTLPQFAFAEEPLRARLTRALLAALVMLVPAAAMAVLAWRRSTAAGVA